MIRRMTQANELIRRAVKVDPARQPAATTPRREPLGLPTSLVLRSTAERPAGAPAPESIAYALADGFAYALDAATGAPHWQLSVGLSAPFAPQPVAGDATVLVVDARHDELLRLDGAPASSSGGTSSESPSRALLWCWESSFTSCCPVAVWS